MTSSEKRVLVVGATGNMGSKIVRELVALGATVRATVRVGSKPETVDKLRAARGQLATVDLADEAALERACDGIDVVVSAVQGMRDVIVDGQSRLASGLGKLARLDNARYPAVKPLSIPEFLRAAQAR